jgi:hypothetical protein
MSWPEIQEFLFNASTMLAPTVFSNTDNLTRVRNSKHKRMLVSALRKFAEAAIKHWALDFHLMQHLCLTHYHSGGELIKTAYFYYYIKALNALTAPLDPALIATDTWINPFAVSSFNPQLGIHPLFKLFDNYFDLTASDTEEEIETETADSGFIRIADASPTDINLDEERTSNAKRLCTTAAKQAITTTPTTTRQVTFNKLAPNIEDWSPSIL